MNTDTFCHEFCYEGASLADLTAILNAVILPLFTAGEGCFAPSKKRLHAKTASELSIGYYTLLCTCTEQLCMWPCSLTKNISVNAD